MYGRLSFLITTIFELLIISIYLEFRVGAAISPSFECSSILTRVLGIQTLTFGRLFEEKYFDF